MDKLAKSAVRKEDIDIYITLSKTEVKSYKMFFFSHSLSSHSGLYNNCKSHQKKKTHHIFKYQSLNEISE